MKFDAYLLLRYDESNAAASRMRGESGDRWYANTITLSDFDFGSSDTEGDDFLAGGKAGAAVTFGPIGFSVAKDVDRATPHLFRAYCLTFAKRKEPKLNFFHRADVVIRKGGASAPLEYVTFVFTGVLVSSHSFGADEDGSTKEKVGFRFQTCQMNYREQLPDGTLTSAPEMKGWSYLTNGPT